MSRPPWIVDLREKLPGEAAPWILTALRQDLLIWSTLENPDLRHRAASADRNADAWTPASLFLLAIHETLSPQDLRSDPLPALPPELLEKSNRILSESQAQGFENVSNFNDCGYLAIALRLCYQKRHRWDSIASQINLTHPMARTILAIFFGFAPDLRGVLSSLLNSANLPGEYEMILQAFLAVPLRPEVQAQLLQDVLQTIQPSQRYPFCEVLSEQRPWLAAQVIAALQKDNPAAFDESDLSLVDPHLFKIYQQNVQIQLNIFAGDENGNITIAQETTRKLNQEASVLQVKLAQAIHKASSKPPESIEPATLERRHSDAEIRAWKDSVRLWPQNPEGLAGLYQGLVENNQMEEAEGWIQQYAGNSPHPLILLVQAEALQQQAVSLSNEKRSRLQELALAALNAVKDHSPLLNSPQHARLAKVLLSSGLVAPALQAIQPALDSCPLHPGYQLIFAEASLQSGRFFEAAEAAGLGLAAESYFRSNVNPSVSTRLLEIFIQALEQDLEWESAYRERMRLLESVDDASASTLRDTSRTALMAGEIEAAAKMIQKALEKNPEDGLANEIAGQVFLLKSKLERAEKYFQKAIRLNSNQVSAWLGLSSVYQKKSQTEQSLETIQAALKANPNDTELLYAFGEYCMTHNAPSQALAPLGKAAQLSKSLAASAKGFTYRKPSAFSAASQAKIALALGRAYQALGRLPESLEAFADGMQSIEGGSTAEPDLLFAYAKCLIEHSDFPQAIPLLEAVIQSQPQRLETFLALGEAYLHAPEQPSGGVQAAGFLQHVISHSLDAQQVSQAEALFAEAQLLAEKFTAAQGFFQKALQSPLGKQPAWRSRLAFGLGKASFHLGQAETALAAFQEAAAPTPNHPTLHRWLAEAFFSQKLFREAFDSALKHQSLSPTDPEEMGWFADFSMRLAESGKYVQILPEAIRLLVRFFQKCPPNPELWLKLARLHQMNGDQKSALSAFERILAADPAQNDPLPLENTLFRAAKAISSPLTPAAAIPYLRKATDLSQLNLKIGSSTSKTEPNADYPLALEIHQELAALYNSTGNSDAASEILRELIQSAPDQPSSYLALGRQLLNHSAYQEAMGCFQKALQLSPADTSLYQYLIWCETLPGNLVEAYQLCLDAQRACEEQSKPQLGYPYRYLAGEISRSLFLFEQAAAALEPQPQTMADDLKADWTCLKAEIAVEKGESLEPDQVRAQIPPSEMTNPRVIALLSRLGQPLALEVMKLPPEPEVSVPTGDALAWWRRRSMLAACASAKQVSGQWEESIALYQEASDFSQGEILIHYQLARALVLQAEAHMTAAALETNLSRDRLYENSSSGAYQRFLSAIEKATRRLSDFSMLQPPANFAAGEQALLHWRDRGLLIFQTNPLNLQAFEGQVHETGDLQAVALASRALSDTNCLEPLNQAIVINPELLIHKTLVQEYVQPWEALESICQLTEQIQTGAIDVCPLQKACAYYLLGRLTGKIGGRNRLGISALKAVERALELNSQAPRWYALASSLCMRAQQTVAALQYLQKAIQLDPADAQLNFLLGDTYLKLGDNQNARTYLEQSCQLGSEKSDSWLALARLQFENGELDRAALTADKAIELSQSESNDHNLVPANILRAEVALLSGNPRGAQSRAQAALKIAPDHLDALQILARALNAMDRSKDALEIMNKIIPQVEKPLPLELERAEWLSQSASSASAVGELRLLAQKYPHEPRFKFLLAKGLLKTNQPDAAILSARQALQDANLGLDPEKQSELYLIIGQSMRKNGQLDNAVHSLNQALDVFPTNLEAHLQLGMVHQDRRQYDQALKVFRAAMHIAAEDYRPYYQAGIVLKEMKDYQKAEELLRRAAELAPGNSGVHRQLTAAVALNLVHNRWSSNHPNKMP